LHGVGIAATVEAARNYAEMIATSTGMMTPSQWRHS